MKNHQGILIAMSLLVSVSSALAMHARALGFSLGSAEETIAAHPAAVKLAWAQGAREVVCAVTTAKQLWELRPLALFAAALGEPLRSGTYHTHLRAPKGFSASEWRTGQQGSLFFVTNITEAPVMGSVFPAFADKTLAAGETVIWPHDFPLGLSENYLAAYAGLVKSEAPLLTAHIRPDPFPGARIFVTGIPGERAEVAVFNAGPGELVEVVFGELPAVFAAGVSQVIAVPEQLAPHLWLLESTTWIGPEWQLDHAGTLQRHLASPKEAMIGGDDEPRSAQLLFEGESPDAVWLNGIPITGSDVTLLPGENRLVVYGEHGPASLIPDGACYLMEITDWQPQSSQ